MLSIKTIKFRRGLQHAIDADNGFGNPEVFRTGVIDMLSLKIIKFRRSLQHAIEADNGLENPEVLHTGVIVMLSIKKTSDFCLNEIVFSLDCLCTLKLQ